MSGCRIGKVRYKKSPHLAEIIPPIRGADYPATIHRFIDTISEYYRNDGMAWFIVVSGGFDGSFSRGVRIHKDSSIGQTLLPSVVADILRRDIMEDIALDVFK